jgi:hypothetical protein
MNKALRLTPEQWILAAALALLGGGCLLLALTLPSANVDGVRDKGRNVEALDPAPLEAVVRAVGTPAQIPPVDGGVLVSRLIVFQPARGKVEYLDPETEMADGIKVKWKLQYGFDLADARLAAADVDGDGFSNVEEFHAGTNPRLAAERPPIIQKLCIVNYEYIPFKLTFKGYAPDPNTGKIYQLNLARGGSRLVHEGDELEGYKIGKFTEKIIEVKNEATQRIDKRDVSELELINPKIAGEIIQLVINVEKESDESRVHFRLEVPNLTVTPDQIQRGGIVDVAGSKYQLIAVAKGGEGATLRSMEDGKSYEIKRCSPTPVENPASGGGGGGISLENLLN